MVSMKSFKKKISLSTFRKGKNKNKNVDVATEAEKPEIAIEPKVNEEDARMEEQENINTQNTETRDNDDDFSRDSTIDKSPIQEDDDDDNTEEEDTSLNHAVNNMLSPSKEESIKRRVTEAIEKVIADIHSDDLTDDDVSSLLASSLPDTAPTKDKEMNEGVEESNAAEYQNEFHDDHQNQSESQENFSAFDDSCSAGYGNSKLCNVFKCDKGVFQRSQKQQTSYEETSDLITEDYTEGKPTTPRVNFCGFFA